MTRRSPLSVAVLVVLVAVLVVLVAVFASAIVATPLLWVGVPPEAVGVVVVVAAVAAGWYGFRRRSGGESVWDAIPRWQYTGRHVESGGLTRDGQEQALRDVEEAAAERRSRR